MIWILRANPYIVRLRTVGKAAEFVRAYCFRILEDPNEPVKRMVNDWFADGFGGRHVDQRMRADGYRP